MLNLKYTKEYSIRNKKSSTNNDVIEMLNDIRNKTKRKNFMRVNVYKQVTLELPYSFKINQNEINENTAIIRLEVIVELLKMIILFTISSLVVCLIMVLVVNSYWVILPITLVAFIFYLLSRL